MNPVWLHSRRLWLLVLVTIGILIVTTHSLLALRDLTAIAEAISSGISHGLSAAGGHPHESSRQYSVTLLFGSITVSGTPHPYLWTTLSGILTGGILGALAWVLLQVGIWSWRRLKRPESKTSPELR